MRLIPAHAALRCRRRGVKGREEEEEEKEEEEEEEEEEGVDVDWVDWEG
jgi:hypothetical protein